MCFNPCSDDGAQTRPSQVANHKAILGLSVCPSLPHQLASYAEVHTHTHTHTHTHILTQYMVHTDRRAQQCTSGTFASSASLYEHFFKVCFLFWLSLTMVLLPGVFVHSLGYHREVVMVTNKARLPQHCVQGSSIPAPG